MNQSVFIMSMPVYSCVPDSVLSSVSVPPHIQHPTASPTKTLFLQKVI
jgi:hypothetical protein